MSDPQRRAHIVAVGASGAVGRTALQLATSARASLLVPHDRPFLDKRGQYIGVSAAGGLRDDVFGYERLLLLAAPPLRACCAGVTAEEGLPLVIAVPPADRPGDDGRLDTDFVIDLSARADVLIDAERSRVVRAGHAGVAFALEMALEMLESGPPEVLVGGVDSYFDPQVLAWLDAECRLLAIGAEDGFNPGEGAAFLLLARDGAPRKAPPLASVRRVITGREATVSAGAPNVADTMTGMMHALVEAKGAPLPWVLTDMNGERHRALEWQKVASRGVLAEGAEESRLVLQLGDVGAASGAMYAAIACMWWHVGCAPARAAAVALHADGDERGAFLLEAGEIAPDEAAPDLELGPPPAPARDQAVASRDAVERALLGFRHLPARVPRPPLVEAAEAAMAALTRLEASDVNDLDHLDRLDGATSRLAALRDLLGQTDAPGLADAVRELSGEERALLRVRERAVDELVARQDRLLRAAKPEQGARAERPFRASVGLPRLHAFPHAPVAPRLDLAPSEHELLALATSAATGALPGDAERRAEPPLEELERMPPGPERPLLDRLALDCITEIASLGNLRRCEGEERFDPDSYARFDQRLLDKLDALVALAPRDGQPGVDVPAELQRYVADAPTLDPERPFARAFVLGAVEGDDAIRAAVLALRQSHPATRAAQADALTLAPSPAIAPAMRRLAAGDDPALAALALDVLRRRRETTLAAALPWLTHPDIAARASAARALRHVPEQTAAIDLLDRMIADELDDRVAAAAAESLVVLGAPTGLFYVRRRLGEELELPGAIATAPRRALLRVLALAGDESDAALLLGSVRGDPEEAEAIGWFGHPGHVEPLLAALERGEGREPVRAPFEVAVSRALRRITGAPVGVPEDRDGAELTGDPDEREDLASAARWRAWWEERRASFPAARRHRFGEPFTPQRVVEELERDGVPARAREVAELELDVLTGGASRFWAHDWVARQRAELSAARDRFAALAVLPDGRSTPPDPAAPRAGAWAPAFQGRRPG